MKTSSEISNGRAILRLQGRFEVNADRDLRTCCQSALGTKEVKELELDLAEVDYFDSIGLGVLLLLKEKAEIAHKGFILSNCRDSVKQMLDVADLKEIFGVA